MEIRVQAIPKNNKIKGKENTKTRTSIVKDLFHNITPTTIIEFL